MTGKAPLAWRFVITSLSLLAAVAVYSFARFHPPELVESFRATNSILAAQTALFGSAPSLFYTLSIGLFIGTCASTLKDARFHCFSWIALAMLLELSQFSTFAEPISNWLATVLPESGWEIVRPYWIRGVFDPLDLLATLVGGCIALALLSQLPTGNTDASKS